MSIGFCQCNTLFAAGSGNTIGATTVVLTSLTDIYGNVLTMADFGTKGYASAEPDTTNEEAFTFTGIIANGNGTYSLTGVKTCLAKSPYTETAGLIRQHAGGTKVVITDNVAFWNTFLNANNTNTVNAIYTFASGATPLITDQPTTNNMVANKIYVDNSVTAGAPNSSTTTKGIGKVDTAPVDPTQPIFVGKNSALFNTYSGTTLDGSADKIVDTGAVALTGNSKILLLTAGGKVTTSTIDTGTGNNQIVQLDGSAKLPAVDGSALTNLKKTIYKTGSVSHASSTFTIAHGLGVTPSFIRLQAMGDANGGDIVDGSYDGTNQSSVYRYWRQSGSNNSVGISTSKIFTMASPFNPSGEFTATFDATNITLTFSGTDVGTFEFHWEAFGYN